jgi:hypothetical protein
MDVVRQNTEAITRLTQLSTHPTRGTRI